MKTERGKKSMNKVFIAQQGGGTEVHPALVNELGVLGAVPTKWCRWRRLPGGRALDADRDQRE